MASDGADADTGAHLAHEAYVKAINSNDLETLLDMLTEDVTDTPRAGGDVIEDTGWGLVTFHHDGDGKWRVARDAFGPDHP